MQMRIRDVALAAAVVTAAACGGGDGDGGEEATPTTSTTQAEDTTSSITASTTSTTAAPEVDPTVIPDDPADIDEAYVEAVLAEHNRVIGDALRLQLEGADPKEIVDRYNAVYVPEVADALLSSVLQPSDEILATLKRPPGDQIVDVVSLREATSDCVEAEVLVDLSPVLADPPAPSPDTVVIRRAESESVFNPTAWLSEGVIPGTEIGEEGC